MFNRASAAAQGLSVATSTASKALNMFGAMAAAGGVALTLGGLIKVNQELESTTNSIAGNIKVYKYADNYADALLLAEETLRRIRADAASLPGSDSDFIRAFSLTFPTQAELGVKSLEEMTKRLNELTAVLLSKGVDAAQAGRDLSLMMRGQAGMDVRSFMELKGVMGVKSTEQWNKMAAKDRLKKLDEARGKFGDTIKAFEKTWDAVTSTGASYLKNFVTEGSKPLFELAKENLKAINDYLGSAQEKILTMSSLFGTMAADAARWVGGLVVGSTVTRESANEIATTKTSGLLEALMPTGFDPVNAMGKTGEVFNYIVTAGNHLLNVLSPVAEVFSSMISVVFGFAVNLAAGFGAVETATGVLSLVIDGVAGAVVGVFDAIGPIFAGLGSVLGTLANGFGDVVVMVAWSLQPAFAKLSEVVGWAIEKFDKFVTWMGQKIGGSDTLKGIKSFGDTVHAFADESRKQLGIGRIDATGFLQKYTANFLAEREKAEKARQERLAQIAKDAAKNKRPEDRQAEAGRDRAVTINQDFRGSKFDIEQKFAQGFDPGRVLTAVREDSAKLAQRRLTAGITPMFGAAI